MSSADTKIKATIARAATPIPRGNIRARVLSVTTQILQGDGYAALTMERVAAISGVAKTTLYRRWPTRASLCMDLYLHVAKRELYDPNTGNVADDLKRIAESVVRLQTRTVAG